MRFTLINSKKKSPFFSLGRNRDVFIILAAAEIALLMLMLLLFVKLRTMVDAPLLISAMLIVMGVFTYFARQSVTLAQSVLIFCVLALQIIFYVDLQPVQWQYFDLKINTNDVLPICFVVFDIAMVGWVLSRGIRVGEEERLEDAPKVRDIDFEERTRR